jgi:hypothetical protein
LGGWNINAFGYNLYFQGFGDHLTLDKYLEILYNNIVERAGRRTPLPYGDSLGF